MSQVDFRYIMQDQEGNVYPIGRKSVENKLTVDRLDEGFVVSIPDRVSAVEQRRGVLDRMVCWLGYSWEERTAILHAAQTVEVKGE